MSSSSASGQGSKIKIRIKYKTVTVKSAPTLHGRYARSELAPRTQHPSVLNRNPEIKAYIQNNMCITTIEKRVRNYASHRPVVEYIIPALVKRLPITICAWKYIFAKPIKPYTGTLWTPLGPQSPWYMMDPSTVPGIARFGSVKLTLGFDVVMSDIKFGSIELDLFEDFRYFIYHIYVHVSDLGRAALYVH